MNTFRSNLFAENKEHAQAKGHHQANDYKISILPVQLRHVVEVHPIDAGNDRQGHEHRCNGGKHAHDFVRPVGDTGLVSFSQVSHQVSISLKCLGYFHSILIDVTEVLLQLVIDETQILLLSVLMTSF